MTIDKEKDKQRANLTLADILSMERRLMEDFGSQKELEEARIENYNQKERRGLIKNLCSVFCISDLNAEKIISTIDNEELADSEDCLQEEGAVEVVADYIVTRDPADYKKSRIKVIKPVGFIKLLQSV